MIIAISVAKNHKFKAFIFRGFRNFLIHTLHSGKFMKILSKRRFCIENFQHLTFFCHDILNRYDQKVMSLRNEKSSDTSEVLSINIPYSQFSRPFNFRANLGANLHTSGAR